MIDPVVTLPLFRSEPLRWRGGEAGVPVRWGSRLIGLAALVLAALAVAGLVWALSAPFARTITLQGRIVSGTGALELYPAQRSTVSAVHVAPGARVTAGTPLLTLERQRAVDAHRDLREALAEHYRHERDLLAAEARAMVVDGRRAAGVLETRQRRVGQELAALGGRIALLDRRLELRHDRLARTERAAAMGALPAVSVLDVEDALLVGEEEHAILLSSHRALQAELEELDQLGDQRRHDTRAALMRVARLRAELERRYLGDRAANLEILRAPGASTVVAVAVGIGASVVPELPVLVLVSADVELAAQLWLPAHAAVDVAPGHAVRVAVDAYPMHRHGALDGVVVALQLLSAAEPRAGYRVDVALDAAGAGFPVRDGQSVSADIVLETRTLWDAVRAPFDRVRMRG